MLFYSNTFAQAKTIPNSFEIKDLKDPSKLNFYTESISNSNMESYRLKDKRNVVKFENGFNLELYSATELKAKNNSLNINNYVSDIVKTDHDPKLNVHSSGIIVILHETNNAKFKNN